MIIYNLDILKIVFDFFSFGLKQIKNTYIIISPPTTVMMIIMGIQALLVSSKIKFEKKQVIAAKRIINVIGVLIKIVIVIKIIRNIFIINI